VNTVSLSFVGMVIPYHIGLTIFQRIQKIFLTPLNKVIHRGARLLFSCYFPSLHLAVSKYSLSFFLYLNPSMNPMTGRNNKQDINNRNKNFILIPKGRFANVFFLAIVFLFILVRRRSITPTQLKTCPQLFRTCYKFHSSSQSSSITKPSRR
jgi:hypothetical protein